MIHLFIFNNASRAASYGIGTYIRQLSDCLFEWHDCKVSFIDLYAETKEFMITEDEQGRTHYQIPALTKGSESENDCYTIFYLLARHIGNTISDQFVFLFNYFQHRKLAELLKGHYIDSRIVLTVHYLSWCFELKGNQTQLHNILSKSNSVETEVEKRVKASFENEKRFLRLADEVLVLSKDTKGVLIEEYGISEDKLHIVYNGLKGSSCSRDLSSTRPRNILFVGRLDEIKGVEYLIKAFKRIVPQHEDCRLMIVGEGNFQPYLAQCCDIHEKVSFFGKVQGEDLDGIYQSAYIGVIPSFHEQCSYSVIEMMRYGIPVIGTDSTGLAEMLDKTPHLRVSINENEFDEENFVAQLATCMDLLLSDDIAYQDASEAVNSLYNERYQSSIMEEKIKEILQLSSTRPDYFVSSDYFKQMDSHMIQLINQHPDIDTEFFGLSGIGVYLWWRVLHLDQQIDKSQLALLLEYLIYCLDWLYEVSNNALFPNEMLATLENMRWAGFYQTRIEELLEMHKSEPFDEMPSEKDIIQNTMKICNCKI